MPTRYKTSCLKCRQEIQNRYFSTHKCKIARQLNCEFCNKICSNLNSAAQHLIRCKLNPDRLDLSHLNGGAHFREYQKNLRSESSELKHKNQFTKALELGLEKPKVSEQTKEKIRQASKKQVWTDERRKNLSDSMKLAVKNHPESYTSSNRGRTKQIEYDGIKFHGSWELKFYIWCKEHNVKCVRNTIGFSYYFDGDRTYFPDFYLTDLDYYVEIKGYKTEKDEAKWKQFPNKLIIIQKSDIVDIQNNVFRLKI